ncbi:hypothetical protein K1T71_004183 [Dendrolimus kikuchii]|uniref:Uncharacterized protein n=1 Tax=Dendrolimus kikuchii TaxID=765133 RepID=A0ACC1DA28_9NEOP|nr:hypothetical protein K1T71_004183 [Dendrolimus kikuchii]
MTHQNHQTNGASLEDCHTNFFALTELYGIKWRKLVWGETSGGGEGDEGAAPLADPVISSYARCLAGDILCVWRRVPAQPPPSVDIYEMRAPARPPPLSLRAAKELWIFWYGEEPDLNGLVAPELISSQGEQGSWESGLSYECRSLLFKALHNLIERCLLSRDFVRLGKWFVQPYDGDEEDIWHETINFPIFENHLILAPFGLEGTLTGREWTDSDPATARLFDAWRQHYPLEQGCGAVEVCCGGARMHYPLPYVLVTEMEAPPASPPAHSLAHRALTALTTPTPHQTPEVCYGDASGDKSEDLVDPTRKTPCTCAKAVAGGAVGGCSPGSGSCGGGSPGAGGSAPPSAGPPPHSPHHAHHAHAQHHHSANNSHQSASAVPTTLHTPAPTPDPHAPPTPAPPSLPPPKAYNQLGKPPTLPSAERRLDPLEDEHSLHMLYDYSTVYAWLEHPVKRFKTEEVSFREELALGSSEGDLYAGHEHTSMPATPHHDRRDYKQERHDHDDTKEYKNLFTSDGLCPTFKDLEQIFDNSDDAASGDETVRLLQVSTPPDSNKSGEERERGCMGRMVRAEELSKMFPTPPSMEAHAQPSPGFSLPDDATPLQRHLHLAAGSPSPDTAIEDWSFVFKPPTVFKYVGSSKYAPLATLPSHLLPPVLLPPHAVYRPRRRRDDDLEPDNCRTECTVAGVKRSASPASDCRESRSRRSCEVGTGTGPPSRGEAHAHSDEPGSVGRHHARSPSAGREARGGAGAAAAATAQADPLLLNVLLGDTVLNVFRDHNFDSCTLCVCNVSPQVVVGNIRGADASTYLCGWGGGEGAESPLPEEEACRCTCGFSAIVNRRLAYRAGLFLEDEIEITGLSEEPRQSGVGGGGGGGGGGGRGLGEVAGVVVAQCAALSGGRASALARAAAAAARSATNDEQRLNLLDVCSMWGCGGGVGGAGGAAGGWCGEGSEARALAFSVFSGARRLLQHHANGKSLTGFGTAADANLFLQAKDEKNRAPYKLFSPLWVLAAPRARAEAESWAQAGAGAGTGGEGAVLFLAYCLSHDQRWLLAAATDARGELLDTAAINIHVPHRSRRRGGGPARRHGLTKLMDFALGLMSNTAQPWRLVVGRVGRIGHGELKGWNWLLSRKHLERASATLKQICGGCAALYPGGTPCILSACLISTEPDPRLRLMADRFTPDERFSQASIQSHLHTPRDVTATHILVFPTSATTQSNQTTFEPSMANGEDDIFLSVDMGEEEMGEENITDLLVGDMFNIWPTSSPRRHDDDPASPQAQHHHNANYHHQDDHNQEQVGLLLQQPLALGYLVSTAPLDAMPAWWWAQCAHLQGLCPAFLKNALHLHTASAPDEDAFSHPAAQQPASAPHRAARDRTHPLDSQITTDVLRYVLEGYNALSWLTLDGDTHDRLSCLPLHVQVLMQLYHTAAALG